MNVINGQISEWLRHAELKQAPNPYSRGFFKKDADQLPIVSEIDGTSVKDFFTVLCIGELNS